MDSTYKKNMVQKLTLLATMLLVIGAINAQKIFTKNGRIAFYSKTPLEDISADNNQVMSVLNTQTGELQFSVMVKNFHFKKALMEEHFNDSYLETDKYPKASFKGSITDVSKVSFATDGLYPVTVSGDLTIHGVTKKITAQGSITVKGGKPLGNARFLLSPGDYNITIPKVVRNNIAEQIEVTVSCNYDQQL